MKTQLENILLEVSKSPLIDDGDLTNAYRLVIKSFQTALNLKRVGIWFWDNNYSAISCQLLIDIYHKTEIEDLTINASDFPLYFTALKEERAILADDAHTHVATKEFSKEYLTPLGINSMLDIPIRHKGNMIGIICCEHIGEKRVWTEDEASFSSSMADLIGRAINANEFKKTEEKLRAINDKLEEEVKERTVQLVESEKMAALGNLVAGVAHEVNTPLGISITASSSISEATADLKRSMEQGNLSEEVFLQFLSSSEKLLFVLESNLSRAAELIQNFKQTAVDYSDQSQHTFDVTESIKYLIISLQPEINKHKVIINFDADESLVINSYPSAWSQIVSNLILNGCNHAFENITTPEIEIKIFKKEQNIHLTYLDNGNGIAKSNIEKIILPFYTSKRGKGGTGLGMSIVYNLVRKQLKGGMKIISDEGKGFVVEIICPIS